MTTAVADDMRASPWWVGLILGAASIILGLLLLSSPGMTTSVLVQFLGIYWLIAGIMSIVSMFLDHTAWGWKLFSGVLGIIAGILILQHPIWATFLVPATLVLVLGIQGIIVGIVGLIQAFQGGGWSAGILGVLSILFGLVLVFNPLVAALGLPLVLGIFALVGGVVAIVQAFRQRSA